MDKERAKALEAAKMVFKNQESPKDFAHQIKSIIETGTLNVERKCSNAITPVIIRLIMSDKSVLMLQYDPIKGKLTNKEAYTKCFS